MNLNAVKSCRNAPYCALGFLLLALCLILLTDVCAHAEKTDMPNAPVLSVKAPSEAFDQTANHGSPSHEPVKAIKANARYTVDFSYLQSVAPNSIAWLYQPNTSINLPVMFSKDPTYYLQRRFTDKIAAEGSIFATGEEAPDFSGPVITLYGRNCLDYTLFGSLSYYRDEAYYRENPTFYLITPDGNYQLDVFAGIRAKLKDDDTWKVDAAEALMTEALPRVLENSFIKPNASSLPVQGDAWAMLSTSSPEGEGTRYVIYARKRPIDDADADVAYVNQLDMDLRESLSGPVGVEGVGDWISYFQNDPLWADLVFEIKTSRRWRSFGDGGCGPTAVAIAIANLVPKEDLVYLGAYALSPYGFRFCSCSVNEYWCGGKHLQYQLTTADEYLRYFPLAVASFATGNNIWKVKGRSSRFGTNMNYLEKICQVFNISVEQTYKMEEVFACLKKENTIAIACTVGYGSPFTSSSHFLVLADIDNEYLYVIDPLRRTNYQELDRNDYLEIVVPGLVRIKLENATRCNFAPVYLLEKRQYP